jgi:hypothetical protein
LLGFGPATVLAQTRTEPQPEDLNLNYCFGWWIRCSRAYSQCMGKPRDYKDDTQDIARDLADIAGQLASLKGEANAWLRDPNYDTLRLRLESEHDAATEAAAVEAREGG